MYTPYSNAADVQLQQLVQHNQLNHPQPQHPNGFQLHQRSQPSGYPNFFQDPASVVASNFARSGLESSNQYINQNLGNFMPATGDLKYFFKISNSYVVHKILLILFPYKNKNWIRRTVDTGAVAGSGHQVSFAPPSEDVNSPDLYIPLMSFVTYILLWASFQGLKGEFHPELFGYLASQTLACSILDMLLFKVGLYLLNTSSQSSLWDIVSFSGYKYVTVVAILCWKNLIYGGKFLYGAVVLFLTSNLSVFLMRSLRFLVLPSSNPTTSATNSITSSQRRVRLQFLFFYAAILQFAIVVFMSK